MATPASMVSTWCFCGVTELFIRNVMPERWMAFSKTMEGAGSGAERSTGYRPSAANASPGIITLRCCIFD